MKNLRTKSVIVLALICSGGWIANTAWAQLDVAKSAVSIVAKQLGVPMNAKFKKFDATVNFNPAQLAQSSAKVDIDMASFDIGDEEYNKEVRGKDWFNTAKYPKATFVSSSIKGTAGKYDVAGKLTIKGHTQDVVVAATYKQDGSVNVFDGVLPIKRNAFSIGEGDWKDTSVVADEVQIKFRIVTAVKK
ncbi:YceI family protein [Glaciimonas immobilis]|uniref:Polyisoprenoid-binding protein YceI n=1 Tax=Glaciimonas immobilis TaxID=728004 RepID=A0A840RZ37_9BURK|nr:YceI family protein [Glaciimonas immobilis]KAF3996096.1 YceI family protein [Glaciimonas immobilis]MBB5201761.1 polyisoprenoid-binding protein YceI [Glaciimonas immobilis]